MAKYKAYPEYKDSGVEWLGEMPCHWRLHKAKYIFRKVQRAATELDGIVTAFRDGQVTLRSNRRVDGFTNALKEIGYQGVKVGDLLVHAMDGFAGAIGISDSDGKCSPVCSVCIPWDAKGTHMRYYGYLVRQLAVTDFILSLAKGIRERSTEFRFSEFSGLFLSVPPLNEQTQIARFLDHETAKIDNLIEKQQQLIELLKEKRQAVISHAVTKGLNPDVPMKDSGVEWLGEVPEHWVSVRVKQISSFITSGPRGWSDFITDEGNEIFLQSGDLNNELGLQLDKAKRVSPPKNAEGVRTKLVAGDVVVCITGANTGRVAIVPELSQSTYINQHLSLIRPNTSTINSAFLGYSLASSVGRSFFDVAQYGLKEGLSLGNVSEAPLALPPKHEQDVIVKYLESIRNNYDNLSRLSTIQIELLKERRTALISAAVTGKIDVRDWVAPASSEMADIEESQEVNA
ncbi:restriction endonuclease subunit S [Pectobacterium odoriferum]|uniref:restriction endonuclease subunit S n=1 Tax=Pectobacterium odoriferum TaxID=78398 RepID=UPI00050376EE|nr:restriction endonuclease subunit S [Pectobacterium odoriferum]KGA36888.1 hypothetical protein KS43_11495 [Pectobacterium odoriferum]